MIIRVRCDCGKVSAFSDADVGLTALCIACGARFVIPEGVVEESTELDHEGQMAPAVYCPISALESMGRSAPPSAPQISAGAVVSGADEPALVSGVGPIKAVFWGILGGAMLAVVALVIVLAVASRPGWEQRNRSTMRELKARGDA